MSLGRIVRSVGGAFGLTVFRELPRGIDVFHDLKLAFAGHRFETLFDVGANVGQSARAMAAAFPGARIFCFEPASDTFALLERNVAALPQVRCHRLALGERPGTASLLRTENLAMRRIVPESEAEAESVTVATLDAFCAANEVARIDFLKIDAEGFDLQVLRGGRAMLERHGVAIAQCEVGLDPDNSSHCSLDAVRDELFAFGYRLFGLYQQKPRETQALRRADAVFASPELLRAHPRLPVQAA